MPFASMTMEDKEAFYALLDEYFESRKELFASWVNQSHSAAAPAAPMAHRPVTNTRTVAPAPSPRARAGSETHNASPTSSSPQPAQTGPTNPYGITVPSLSDLRDPRFQSAFKAASSGLVAAGGFANKYMMKNQPGASPAAASPAGSDVAPPKAAKPAGLGSAFAGFAGGSSAPPKPPAPAPPVGNRVRGIGVAVAQFDYPSQEAGDLPFSEGDKITILSKESDDWWKGHLNGREGLFPASYVSEV